ELLNIHVGERNTEDFLRRYPDRIERDIDTARFADHGLQMLGDGLLVENIDLRCLDGSACRHDVLGDGFHRRFAVSGKKNLSTFVRKGASNSTADCTSGSVNHC